MINAPKGYRYFDFFAMVYIASLLVANTVAVKIFQVLGFTFEAGLICFPIVFIVNDVVVEVYGYERARRITWYAIFCQLLMVAVYYTAVKIEPYNWTPDVQHYFETFFGLVPRIVVGSFTAFLVASFSNAYIMSILKIKTKGKHLWIRTITSTIVGEGLDSLIFSLIAFSTILPNNVMFNIILSSWAFKVAYEILFTPIVYIVVNKLKKLENEDKYDVNISYNPFKI